MDIQNTWNNFENKDESFDDMLRHKTFLSKPSKHPLLKLKSKLLSSLIWAAVITTFYFVLLFYISEWIVIATIILMIMFNSWLMILTVRLYIKIPREISPEKNVKQMLEQQYSSFLSWQNQQEKVALFVYPFAAAGGFILGGTVGAGKPVEVLFQKLLVQIALPVTIIILVPVCYYLAKWMFKIAYGKELNQLKSLIAELNNNG